MRLIKHLLLLAVSVTLSSFIQAQSVASPILAYDDVKIINSNGFIDFNELNPTYFEPPRIRSLDGRIWNGSQWITIFRRRINLAADCVSPISTYTETYDTTTRRFTLSGRDTFVYVGGRLATHELFNRSVNGSLISSEVSQFYYTGNNAQPDSAKRDLLNGNRGRYQYTYNASKRPVTIVERVRLSGIEFLYTKQYSYDAQGRLLTYRGEEQNLTTQKRRRDSVHYSYTPRGQVSKATSTAFNNAGAIEFVESQAFGYTDGNLTSWSSVLDGDTILKTTVKLQNAKKRPLSADYIDNVSGESLRYEFGYSPNDTTVRSLVIKEFDSATNTYVNYQSLLYEYCGEFVSTKEFASSPVLLSIAPNPAVDALTLSLNAPNAAQADITISNLVGQILDFRPKHALDTPLSIAGLPSGFYVIKVQSGASVGVTKFSVVR